MRKYRQVNIDGEKQYARRMFVDGLLKVNSVDKDKNYKVSLMLLNGKRNRNGWVYENISQNLSQFVNIPILCAWVNDKPDGHNFDIKVDPETGQEYASFTSASAEKIIGWINPKTPQGEDNAYIAVIDGVEWVCVREAFIPYFYNKEFIDELEREGGQMKVSIETLVTKFRIENNTEYEEAWTVVGVTVISVTEAVAGANIKRKVNASYGDELKKIKLRAAQYYASTYIEPQTQQKSTKGVGKSMKILNLDDIRDKFEGYTVLGCNGLSVALLSDEGRTFTYTFQENEDTVVPSRIEAVAVNSVFGEGDGAVTVSAEQLIGTEKSQLNAAKAALEKEVQKNAELTAKLNKMEEQETARRKEAVKAAIKSRLADNKRDCGYDLPDTLCDSLMTDECVGKYAGMVDEHGAFCGEKQAMCDVDALCMDEIRKENKAKAEQKAKNNGFKWSNIRDGADESGASKGVMSSLARISK